MIVYGIYISDYESGYFDTPFYNSKEKAYEALRPKLSKMMQDTKRMQEFEKAEDLGDGIDYKDWKQETTDKWAGGFLNLESIEIVEIEVT